MSFFQKTKQSGINLDWGRKSIGTKRDMRGYWYNVSRNFNLTQDDVREFADQIDWGVLSMNKQFPFDDAFLAEFADKIEWNAYAVRHAIPEAQYLKFKKYIRAVYFIAGQGKETKNEMAAKYWGEVSDTKEWIDYHEDYGYFSANKSRHSEREEVLFWMRGISPQFRIEHISTPEEWKRVSNQLNPKLVLKYWDKIDKDSLINFLHRKMYAGGKYSWFPETWKSIAMKLKPYFEERKKIKIHPRKNWQDQNEQELRNDFDAAYKNIMKSKQEWQDWYYSPKK